MSSKDRLLVDWATHAAAKYACENWHYTGSIPNNAPVKVGAWEDGRFIGVVLFGTGSGNMTRGDRYGFAKTHEVAELARVALREHDVPTSRIVSQAVRMLKGYAPRLRMLISFADEAAQGHLGTLYQACGWIYTGTLVGKGMFIVHGERVHPRSMPIRGWVQSLNWLRENVDPDTYKEHAVKHRYLYPMDSDAAAVLEKFRQPYPKRAKQAMAGTPGTAARQRRPARSR